MNLDQNEIKGDGDGKLKKLMKKVFTFYDPADAENTSAIYDTADQSVSAPNIFETGGDQSSTASSLGSAGTNARDTILNRKLPDDRFARYQIYAEMAEDPLLSGAIELLLSYALSPDRRTNLAITLKPKDPKDAKIVNELMNDIIKPINKQIMSWAYTMAIYGVNYIRPYGEVGKGIVSFEASYYTLPNNIKEFHKGCEISGFTSINLKRTADGGSIRLADPWALIPLKIPSWHPNLNSAPMNNTGREYSLFDDVYNRLPSETQNYGTSLIHPAFEAWINLKQALRSLLASRQNASRIDRLISVATNGLSPQLSAAYLNSVASQLKNDREAASRAAAKDGILPTIFNSIIPVMGEKGSVSIDTQMIEPNINAIEDIMFYVKSLGGAIGIDPALLGFSDQMSSGLGDGGWLTTSIQSAIRSNLIRNGVAEFIYRAIDIHTAYKYGKVWLENEYPFELQFNTLNTAIAQEEGIQAERRANYATIAATALDTIEQGLISKSNTLKGYIYKDLLEMDDELANKIIAELAAAAKESDDANMMESIAGMTHDDIKQAIGETLFEELAMIKSISNQ